MAERIKPNNETALVLGLGMTGYSIIQHLSNRDYAVTVADSREFPPYLNQVKTEYPDIEIITDNIPYEGFGNYSRIVASPGIEIPESAYDFDGQVVGDIELFAQSVDAPVIGITGSNGKSTVTMLVSEILKASGLKVKTGGNIGTPALALLDGQTPDFYVLELSSFQLETTYSLRLASATVLNVSEDHMDRYDSLNGYIEAKLRVFQNADKIIVNRDDCHLLSRLEGVRSFVTFGLDAPDSELDFGTKEIDGVRVFVQGGNSLGNVNQLTLQGEQNHSNILAAFALVSMAGVALKPAAINAALRYGGLPHRCEIVTECNGVKWINDSKGTNVGATVAAIEGFGRDVILIAGGKGKGANFDPLAKAVSRAVKHTILFGEDADLILDCLEEPSPSTLVGSLDDAVIAAYQLAQSGDIVLFSPACSSFDMFDNFEHRGNAFKQLVLELVH